VTRVVTQDEDHAASADHFTFLANPLDACPNLHHTRDAVTPHLTAGKPECLDSLEPWSISREGRPSQVGAGIVAGGPRLRPRWPAVTRCAGGEGPFGPGIFPRCPTALRGAGRTLRRPQPASAACSRARGQPWRRSGNSRRVGSRAGERRRPDLRERTVDHVCRRRMRRSAPPKAGGAFRCCPPGRAFARIRRRLPCRAFSTDS